MAQRTPAALPGIASIAAALFAVTAARAEDGPWQRKLSVDTHFGTTAAPLGAVAISAEWTPLRYLGVELGAGVVDTGDRRLGAMLWGRVPVSTLAFALGAGATNGPYDYDVNAERCKAFSGAYPGGFGCDDRYESGSRRWKDATFINAAIAVENRMARGFHFRGAFGASYRLNSEANTCVGPPCVSGDPARLRYYFDLVFGYAF